MPSHSEVRRADHSATATREILDLHALWGMGFLIDYLVYLFWNYFILGPIFTCSFRVNLFIDFTYDVLLTPPLPDIVLFLQTRKEFTKTSNNMVLHRNFTSNLRKISSFINKGIILGYGRTLQLHFGFCIRFCLQGHPICEIHIITARKRSLRRLCFHRCLSVHRGGICLWSQGGVWQTPPWADTPPPPGRHPPHAGLRSTSWRYASHWNALLF